MLTPGNGHDIKALPRLAQRLFGDKGYLSTSLFRTLFESYGIQLLRQFWLSGRQSRAQIEAQ